MQIFFVDCVGKLPRSKAGNSFFFVVCVDASSKFVWVLPVREMTRKRTIKALRERIFCTFSIPEVLVTDNARCFTSREFRQFCLGLGIKQVTTSPYYPQPSHAERFNRNLRSALVAFHSDTNTSWDSQLVWLQLAFNMAEQEATKAPPFLVMFPFRANQPLCNRLNISQLLPGSCNRRVLKQLLAKVKESLLRSNKKMARRYNSKRLPYLLK
jgi:transposase InsO family protein